MTRLYKLQRLQKNILLGMAGIMIASSMAIASATTTASTTKEFRKAQKEKKIMCKKDSQKSKMDEKKDVEKKYWDMDMKLKRDKLNELDLLKNSSTTSTSTKEINKERKEKRMMIENKYKEENKKLRDAKEAEKKAIDMKNKEICKNEISNATTSTSTIQ